MPFFKPEDIIPQTLQIYGLTYENFKIFDIWENEFSDISDHVKLIGMKNDTILLEVDTSVHLNELKLRKNEILKKINSYFGYEKFKNIKRARP